LDVKAAGALGYTPLMWTCLRGQADIVSKLLTFPTIDVHAKNTAGSTALDIAYKLELFEIAKCLEDYAVERGRKRTKYGPPGDGSGQEV
jgi:ankyrin repeat protein